MTIDPKALPDDTVLEASPPNRMVSYLTTAKDAAIRGDLIVMRAFVPVPDGMSVEDATQALADHVQWVPMRMDRDEAPVGARIRHEYTVGQTDHRWLIHLDDAPTDPDAELIEAMARAIHAIEFTASWDRVSDETRDEIRETARAALAVVREHEAGTR